MYPNACLVPGLTSVPYHSADVDQLLRALRWDHRPKVPPVPTRRPSGPRERGTEPELWSAPVEQYVEHVARSIDVGQAFAKSSRHVVRFLERGAGLVAFRDKYYNVLTNTVTLNRAGDLRGIVVSADARRFFNSLGKVKGLLKRANAALTVAEVLYEGTRLSWEDTSPKGIYANSMVTLARGGTRVALETVGAVGQLPGLVGGGLERIGFAELSQDLKGFSRSVEGTIASADAAVDEVMSVENMMDVLDPDRSVLNLRRTLRLISTLAADEIDYAKSEAERVYDHAVTRIIDLFE